MLCVDAFSESGIQNILLQNFVSYVFSALLHLLNRIYGYGDNCYYNTTIAPK